MATKIRRCLYIGLGGVGIKTILHTKKQFIDTYDVVPPMIGFLGIDTDSGEFNSSLTASNGDKVDLYPNESLLLHTPRAVDFFNENKERFSWIPKEDIGAIAMLNGVGAGGVRSNGRFAFTVNKDYVQVAIKNKLNEIQNARIINNSDYELFYTADTEIHIVFSLCGGTGAGIFLNIAYLLQELYPNLNINGYAVLPKVFKSMPLVRMDRIVYNAYNALVDLDFLMRDTRGFIDYLDEQYVINSRPFDSFLLIDDENKNGDIITDINQLTEMISIALISASSREFSVTGTTLAGIGDVLTFHQMNTLLNQGAWASGMGACEIVYRGNILADIYKYKAGINIIDRMFNSCEDAKTIANAWIDSSEVHIRENNGQDHVTDYICSKEPRYQLEISNYKDPLREVNYIIERNRINDEDVTAKVEALLTKVRTELRKLLVANINEECGISSAQNIIEELKIQIGICLQEMKAEKEELVARKALAKSAVETAIIDLKDYAGKIFFVKRDKEQRAAYVAEAVRQYCTTLLDIQRHDAAITFYNSILVNFNESENKIANIAESLKAVKSNLTQKINTLQKGVSDDETIFQINLASEDAKCVTVKSEDVCIPEFISSLSGNFKIYGFTEYSAAEIEDIIIDFTETLSECKTYSNKSVEQVLEDISRTNPDRLKEIIKFATHKASPYLHPENQDDVISLNYIGVYNANDSILAKNFPADSFIANVKLLSTGNKHKIIVYCRTGVMSLPTIENINRYKLECENCKYFVDDSLYYSIQISDNQSYIHIDNEINCGLDNYLYNIAKKRPVPKGQIAIARDFAVVLNDNGHQTLIGKNDTFKQLYSPKPFVKVAAAFDGYMALTDNGRIITGGKASEFDRSCEIERIRNVKDVVASEGHTVVLFDNGTVESIDEPGGCECAPQHHKVVKGWHGIKQVAVGYCNVMGLTEDGKVLYHSEDGHTNPHFYDDCSDVVQIDCYSHYYGTDSSAVLHRDGTVSSDTFEGVERWSDIIQISVGADIIVGLKNDGTIEMIDHRNERYAAKEWKNIASIECKFFSVVGITKEGEILSL